jgi:hypothetical protein
MFTMIHRAAIRAVKPNAVKREVAAVDTSPENSNRNADESDNGQELQYQLQDFEWSHAAGYVSGGNADDV